eukprot:5629873-Heterocapsa_arctica.AAC.1
MTTYAQPAEQSEAFIDRIVTDLQQARRGRSGPGHGQSPSLSECRHRHSIVGAPLSPPTATSPSAGVAFA